MHDDVYQYGLMKGDGDDVEPDLRFCSSIVSMSTTSKEERWKETSKRRELPVETDQSQLQDWPQSLPSRSRGATRVCIGDNDAHSRR